MEISSRTNTKIKHLRRLQQSKYRRQSGTFVLEGQDLIVEALRAGYPLWQLYAQEDAPAELMAQAQEVYTLSPDLLAYVSAMPSAPTCLAVLPQREIDEEPERYRAWLLAENLQDPGNFGALLRLADAMNWRGILALGEHPDPWQAKVIRGSMGSSLRLPVRSIELAEVQAWQAQGWTLAAAAAGTASSSFVAALAQPLILALGHEGQGLSSELSALAALHLSIPIRAGVDSLNVVTAAAMLVHESNRQWSQS